MLTRAEERLVRGLARRKVRGREGLFLAEGVRVVEELLAAGLVPELALVSPALQDTERGRRLAQALAGPGLRQVSHGRLADLADTETPQGVLVAAPIPQVDLEGMHAERGVVLVLDGVQDPGNVGTLLRTAAAFGVALVAALPGTADPWNPKVVRAAAGACFHVPVAQPEADALVAWLRGRGFRLLGADMAGVPVESVAVPDRTALVLGNEGAGLSAGMAAALDTRVAVPISGAESLNVAVAAGILLYLVTRKATS
ncbi:MAG TPA: RNA methyltransferase [Longimicrobiales bacterium]|nr:RNA methyltransferase [Longimicrobiales bacterium]